MIDISTAGELLNFGARMDSDSRAQEQLQGAVAIHNMLKKNQVAYLADEVGMGKTYVALGALALFRHFKPDFKALIIAPRENIQRKWMKEMGNFAAYNVKFSDFRNRTIDRQPGRPMVACNNLIHLVHEAVVDPRRDFFARLGSFSLGLSDKDGDRESWRKLREQLLKDLPWLSRDTLPLRGSKEEFKDNFARAVCCALPKFDLVIIDEGHNLKHGLGLNVAARNRVLALALGHPSEAGCRRNFPGYGPRADRVLFLSATPLEASYRQLWNQLNVLGKGDLFEELRNESQDEEKKKELTREFLIRRVTCIKSGETELTKNQYRREWRKGGVHRHDEPISVLDSRQRLIVALVQKKVAELLGSEKFNMSFQIGMLASFESFLETALHKKLDDGEGNFDDPDQTDDLLEKEGIDVRDINRLARHFRKTFGREMPHPKMDALVAALCDSWQQGRKALVFVRRVASVKELERKLNESYDAWLIRLLRERLPEPVLPDFNRIVDQYRREQLESEAARRAKEEAQENQEESEEDRFQKDPGGNETFFAWFFRGDKRRGVISGANIQQRFVQKGTALSTFFENNLIAELLGVAPGEVTAALARHLELTEDVLRTRLRERAAKYLGRAKKRQRGEKFEAFQGAAMELLKESASPKAKQAGLIWDERFKSSGEASNLAEAPEIGDELEVATFFTEILRPEWQKLRADLWPERVIADGRDHFRETQLRAQLLATAARLGHSLIDLYVLVIGRLKSLKLRTIEESSPGTDIISDYLAMLESQRLTPREQRPWGAYDELSEISRHFDLILDVNAPEARTKPLTEAARMFGRLLPKQQPVVGMFGQINGTAVKQFRMPGYPFVLVTTDLLQEGEDLHTFCSNIYHYGISWTPSAMEQRIGRIDRVKSLTDRLLNKPNRPLPGEEEKLQVFYPYLSDTVEVLQVNRVLERMNTFLRLMHEDLKNSTTATKTIQVAQELVSGLREVESIKTTLKTAFPVPEWACKAPKRELAVKATAAVSALDRFHKLRTSLATGLPVVWEPDTNNGRLLGTVKLATGRIQPFTLLLRSNGDSLVVRCISPVGRVDIDEHAEMIAEIATHKPSRIGVILTEDDRLYDVTVEDDVRLADESCDGQRVLLLLQRVLESADILEQNRFGPLDHPMGAFESDLRKEGVYEIP